MPGIKEIKNRIKSIKSTRKITKAMQMVSAAKMRKAQEATLKSRKYSTLAWELITHLNITENQTPEYADESLSDDSLDNPKNHKISQLMTASPKATKIAYIVISSNKGLVGSLNTNLFNQLKAVTNNEAELIAELVAYGKKAKDYAVRFNKNLVSDFPKKDIIGSVETIYPLANTATNLYLTGQYKKIYLVYNDFISTLSQKPVIKQLLPFRRSDEALAKSDELLEKSSMLVHRLSEKPINGHATDYLFEPDPQTVIDHLIPRIIESQIYQAVLESDASEHSARMVMMKNATESAGELIDDYTLTYNQLRQNKITTELAEITAGKIALE
jgi:F-type H+-transporting ATPase subunit gamma